MTIRKWMSMLGGKRITSLSTIKSLTPLFFALVFVFSACIDEDSLGGVGGVDGVGSERQFWASDLDDNPYRTEAVVVAVGDHCKIWVEKGINIDLSKIQGALNECEKIYNMMVTNYSAPGPIRDPDTKKIVGNNILEAANNLVNSDGKLSIFILDIPRDDDLGYYTAGYFWPGDLFSKSVYPNSNECDVVYLNAVCLDEKSTLYDPSLLYTTLAHEMQHLMNFTTSYFLRTVYDTNGSMADFDMMDLWIDEGLAASAEWVYSGKHNQERLDRFSDGVGAIAYGNNFFVWGEDPDNLLDEYATVYIFFQWLRLQTKSGGLGAGAGIYKEIITSKYYDHNAVVEAVKGKGNYSSDTSLQWGTLLRDWLAANVLVDSTTATGKYSYMGDPDLSELIVYPLSSGTIDLYPGEGVYSITTSDGVTSSYKSGSGPNIKYTGVNFTSNIISDTRTFASGALITYNTNTFNEPDEDDEYYDLLEMGRTASINYASPSSLIKVKKDTVPIIAQSQAKSKTTDKLSKPHAISMGDLLRMRGHKKTDFGFKKSGLPVFKKAGKDK